MESGANGHNEMGMVMATVMVIPAVLKIPHKDMRRVNVTAESNSLTLDKSPIHAGETDPPIDDSGHLLLHHHFDDMSQQRGMQHAYDVGLFGDGNMMFGGLFCAYAVYRWSFPHAFAIGSHHSKWFMGSLNTGVLLVSSLTMAMAVHSAALRNKKRLVMFLAATLVLGWCFIGVKGVEWTQDYYEGLVPGVIGTITTSLSIQIMPRT